MKTRTINVYLELQTDAPLSQLKSKSCWQRLADSITDEFDGSVLDVRQATATVAQPVKTAKKGK